MLQSGILDPALIEEYSDKILKGTIDFVPKVLLAGLVLFIGFKIVAKLFKILKLAIDKTNIPFEVAEFLGSLINIVLKLVVIAIAASIVGFKLSSIITLLGALVFAVGLALQGFLGNFASGLTIIFFRPYKVGDWVQISDMFGKVQKIEIFNTTLITPGKKTLVIPNGQVTDNIITNMSTEGEIRLELQVTMPYEESFPKIRGVIEKALSECEFVVHDKPAYIGIEAYDSHNIVVGIRPFINPDYFWEAKYEVYRKVKHYFQENSVKMAYSEGVELGPIGA